jgi:hypothetical protein
MLSRRVGTVLFHEQHPTMLVDLCSKHFHLPPHPHGRASYKKEMYDRMVCKIMIQESEIPAVIQ